LQAETDKNKKKDEELPAFTNYDVPNCYGTAAGSNGIGVQQTSYVFRRIATHW
jgi:hypothetical protein